MIDESKINSQHEMILCLEQLKQSEFKLAYFFVEPTNTFLQNICKLNGGILIDKKTTYEINNFNDPGPVPLVESFDGSVNNLIDLAFESGLYSRYKIDTNFKNGEFEKLYIEWITASVNKKIANEVLVYKDSSELIGLVTLNVMEMLGQIGLIAVSKKHRGKGIGKKLIEASHHWYRTKGIFKAKVVTQGINIQACKLYEQSGYHISEIKYIYHFWF
jgi:dTDP-4-amino-4,6-dideoxy-D-galactose acyltransferase